MNTHTYRSAATTALLIILVTLPISIPQAMAQEQRPSINYERTITVNGEGVIQMEPDQATVRFGIVTRHEDPEEARRQNAEAASQTMNAVRALGIEERKIKLETLRLQPVQVYNNQTRRHEEAGFEAIREVVVVLEDLDILPTLIAEVVQKGANRLQGITYGLQEEHAGRDEALRKALQDAKAKATLMAETLGASLGRVLTINEGGVSVPRPMVRMAENVAMAKAYADPAPDAYAAGEMDIRAHVTVVFEIQ